MYPTWYLWIFLKILSPFIDPKTVKKINLVDPEADKKKSNKQDSAGIGGFVSSILNFVDPEQLLEEYGGSLQWEWNFEDYWNNVKVSFQ
jgi:hypothetical protein